MLRSEAFQKALAEFCAGGEPDRLRLLATYGANGLRRMLTGVYETLRSAGRELELGVGEPPDLAERLEELREAARALPDEAAAQLLALLERDSRPDVLLDLSGFRLRADRAVAYEEARRAVEQAALDEAASRDRDLLQELLERFALAYAAEKARESALDFEDLQLNARDLLRDHGEIREREALRFRSIMVDEFQDTNRLQCELIDQLAGAGAELFYVGDEFQSIYGFRHADVGVFRERREQAGQLLPLTLNYRSRPEVLAAVNELFSSHFGDEFQPLHAAAEFPDPVFGNPVELLVTDKAAYHDTGVHWRRAEARAIARRVRELVDSGAAKPGEIVVLFAAGTDAEVYEQELRRAGLPTYRATGKGYFGQQQVVDLLAYLRLLQNRYDDRALVTVLASPFVGVSNDALALLRRSAYRRPMFTGLERTLPEGLSERDEQLMRAFRQRYDRLAAALPRLSLERLCERVVSEHDYDLAVLALWDGRRRYANMRKLARLARSYEELRGPDVEGFVRFVGEQEALGAHQLEAVAEEEGADAVRLLTIHAAKGLEFEVVIVADAGRDKAPPSPDEILALSDGRFGFRVADPVTTKRRGAFDYEEVKAARKAEDDAEKLRLYYVAMTRARQRLIVSGAVDREKAADASTPIGWVLGRLEADAELAAAGDAPIELVRNDAHLLVRVDRYREADWREEPVPEPEAPAEPAQLELFAALEQLAAAAAPELAPLVPPAEPPLHRVRRLSFTALSTFGQCSYKYYARYGLGMKELPVVGRGPGIVGDRRRQHRARPARGDRSRGAGRPRARARARDRGGGRARTRIPDDVLRVGSRAACRSASGRDEGAAVHVRARRRAHPRLPRRAAHRGRQGARRRLQDERARRGIAGGDRRRGLPAAAARLRARLLPRRRGRGGGRLPLPRACGRGRVDVVHAGAARGARGGALGSDRADPGRRVPADAERLRVHGMPGARSRLRRSAAARAGGRVRRQWLVASSPKRASASECRSASASASSSSGSRSSMRTPRSR